LIGKLSPVELTGGFIGDNLQKRKVPHWAGGLKAMASKK
jgi:hypothetical protein